MERAPCDLLCSQLSWLGSVKRESVGWRCHMKSGDIWQSTQRLWGLEWGRLVSQGGVKQEPRSGD